MEKLVIVFGPIFAAGFAIQRLLEVIDPVIDKINFIKENKKVILGLVSLVIGLVLAFGLGLKVLKPLGMAQTGVLDEFVTGLIISAGTEGVNSILKFLGYSKEDKKNQAAQDQSQIPTPTLDLLQRKV